MEHERRAFHADPAQGRRGCWNRHCPYQNERQLQAQVKGHERVRCAQEKATDHAPCEKKDEAVIEQPEQEQDKQEASNEGELQEYSKNVQQRISKLTKKYRDEEAQRLAAVEFAEAVKKQNDELKQRLSSLDQSYTSEFGTRVDSQIEAAKQAYQKAYDDGDSEAMFEAQKNLSKLALDQAQLEQAKRKQEQKAQQPAEEPVQEPVQSPMEEPVQAPVQAAPVQAQYAQPIQTNIPVALNEHQVNYDG